MCRGTLAKNKGGLLIRNFDRAIAVEVDSQQRRLLTEGRCFVVAEIGAPPVAFPVLEIIPPAATGNSLHPLFIRAVDAVGDHDGTAVSTISAGGAVDPAHEDRAAEIVLALALKEGCAFESGTTCYARG